MSFVISVQASLPCAHACEDGIVSSRSDASSSASMVTMVCSSNSRIAPRAVLAIGAPSCSLPSGHRSFPIVPIATMNWTLYEGRRYDKRQEVFNDLPSLPLAQDWLRQLPARLKRRSQLRCGGSTARHRAVPRRGIAEEHADHAHFRDPRP